MVDIFQHYNYAEENIALSLNTSEIIEYTPKKPKSHKPLVFYNAHFLSSR